MELTLQTIAEFNVSNLSIFTLTRIDYPTLFQQKLINSYLDISKIIIKDHNQIVKVFHTANQRNLENIVLGLIYSILLNPQQSHHLIQYLKNLKIQARGIAAKILQQILVETFNQIKSDCKLGLCIIYSQLFDHHSVNDNLTIMMIKSIDCFDMTQKNLTYTNFLLEIFSEKIKNYKKQSQQQLKTLCKFLFFKLLRLSTMLYLIQDEAIDQFKIISKKLTLDIWQLYQNQCLSYGHQIMRYCQELQRIRQYKDIIQQIQNKIIKVDNIDWMLRQTVVSVVLPIRVQTVLLFIKDQKIGYQAVWTQLNWLWKQQSRKSQNAYFLLVDMARWSTIVASNIQEKVYILQWIVKKAQQDYIVFQMVKQSIFIDWFQISNPFHILYTSLQFLSYIISADIRIGEDLLSYILGHKQKPFFHKKIRDIFIETNRQGIINLNDLIHNQYLSQAIRQQLRILFHGNQQKGLPLQFDPAQSYQQIDYNQYQKDDQNINQQQKIKQQKYIYKINLQQQFVQAMENTLNNILNNPSIQNYQIFIKKVIDITKQHKKENQNQQIQLIIQETSKVIYLVFNYQFQYFKYKLLDNNILIIILKQIIQNWRLGKFRIEMLKKIVKKIIQLFPQCQYSFWKNFFQMFKRGAANNKDVCQWLVGKEKYPIVVERLTMFMGKQVINLYENIASYYIPIPRK